MLLKKFISGILYMLLDGRFHLYRDAGLHAFIDQVLNESNSNSTFPAAFPISLPITTQVFSGPKVSANSSRYLGSILSKTGSYVMRTVGWKCFTLSMSVLILSVCLFMSTVHEITTFVRSVPGLMKLRSMPAGHFVRNVYVSSGMPALFLSSVTAISCPKTFSCHSGLQHPKSESDVRNQSMGVSDMTSNSSG